MSIKWDYDWKLEYERPAGYEGYTSDDMARVPDHIRRFLMYRELGTGFDADSCPLAKKIYGMLWSWKNNAKRFQEIQVGDTTILMGMETINSFATSLFHVLRLSGLPRISARNYTKDTGERIEAAIGTETYAALEKFALLTHTMGNFTLIPKKVSPYTDQGRSFNQVRGFQSGYGTYDFFDLGLKLIEKHAAENNLNLMDYARTFLLEDYYAETGILPLCPSHAAWMDGIETTENALPGVEELPILFDEINRRIESRGKRMEALLREAALLC